MTAPKNETKRDKFVRLIERRVSSTLKDLELVENMFNPRSYKYDYTQEDFNKVINTLDKRLKRIKKVISEKESNNVFKLD